jgi:transposase
VGGASAEGGVLFEWYTTREAKCLDKLIPIDFSGTIQCDGYSAYDYFARHRATKAKPVLLAGCWAHARRGFYEALDHAPQRSRMGPDPDRPSLRH